MKQFSDESDEENVIPLGESSDEEESNQVSDDEISLNRFEEDVSASDSDSAPECISFSESKEKIRQAEKLVVEAVKLQKAELKRKRKEILLQNLQQREEKRKKIESKRLPDHILENLDDDFEVDKPVEKIEEQELSEKEDDVETEFVETAGNITFKCKVIPVEAKKPKYVREEVAHFKDKMLYGGRIRREKSNRDAILKREKQRVKR